MINLKASELNVDPNWNNPSKPQTSLSSLFFIAKPFSLLHIYCTSLKSLSNEKRGKNANTGAAAL